MTTRYASIGPTYFETTLRTEDRLPNLTFELDCQLKRQPRSFKRREMRKLIARAERVMRRVGVVAPPCDTAADLVTALEEALGEFAAPYCYFGHCEGDPADFGYWPNIEALEEDCRYGDVVKVDAGDPLPKGRDVMIVNDHGNVTFGHVNSRGKFREFWSAV